MSKPLEPVFVAIDLETTGKYPFDAEVCEIAMIKFNTKGEELETWESLVKPRGKMDAHAQEIHGLSLEDLKDKPSLEELLPDVMSFIGGHPLVGHNIPFDLGFLMYDLEQHYPIGVKKLNTYNFCTSLISINLYPKLKSHRLLHLAQHFKVEEEPNHRALQDARTCKKVFLQMTKNCFELEDYIKAQEIDLKPRDFSPEFLAESRPELIDLVTACKTKEVFELMYSKGSYKNKWRDLQPVGLVLKQGDEGFLVAQDPGHEQTKRFLVSKILDTRRIEV